MAISKRFEISHHTVFPKGAYLRGFVEPVPDFQAEQRPDGSRPQQRDKDTGLPLWQCTVIDGDDDANRKDIGVSVKFAAEVQPVPPKNTTPAPWTPVVFEGLTALPYIDESGNRPRIAWSFRAQGFAYPAQAAKPPEQKAA